jgi:hypothetical protein
MWLRLVLSVPNSLQLFPQMRVFQLLVRTKGVLLRATLHTLCVPQKHTLLIKLILRGAISLLCVCFSRTLKSLLFGLSVANLALVSP